MTTADYESLVQSIYPNAQSVSAWGGEDEENPVYGVVKIAIKACLLYTSPSPRDGLLSRMPSSA